MVADPTRIIAHRGASQEAPENTLAAFELALEQGADCVELDCQLTRDGHVVVMHDNTVNRTTNGAGKVRAMSLAEIKALDAGSWFHPRFAGERVPTLAEALRLLRGRCTINIEIKSLKAPQPGIEEKIVDLLRSSGVPLETVIISSFNHAHFPRFRTIAPSLRLAALFQTTPANLHELDVDFLHPSFEAVTPDLMQTAKAAGRKVNAWTVDAEEEWCRLLALGVDGIITNAPGALRAFLSGGGEWAC